MESSRKADALNPGTDESPGDKRRRELTLGGRSLREQAARGVVINAVFMIALAFLSMTKGFVVAVFVDSAEYGIWGIVVVSLSSVARLGQLGIGDKYIQQDEEDQELAYQKAFTLELLLALITMVVLAALVPLFAFAYGQWEIVAPALAVLLIMPAAALSTSVWIYYRQMQFLRQRVILAVDPVVGFVVTVALAAAGAGYWSFVIGILAGVWSMALAALISTPVKMRLRFDRATLRSYASFSWPLFAAGGSSFVLSQSSTFATNAHLGVAAVGAVALAANLAQFANRVQELVEGALYPAVCAVKDRTDLLRESFLKSNRLGMMWGIPFGVGLSLFFADLVHFGIGSKWEPAVPLLQVTGLVVAMAQICFNYDAYYRARGNTKPIAVVGWSAAITFLVIGIPLLLTFDLRGLAYAIGIQAVVAVALRIHYVRKMFNDVNVVRHALSGLLPVVPGVVVVLGLRLIESGPRTVAQALVEAALFMGLTAAATWTREAPLLREMFGYLTRGRKTAGAAA